MLMLKVLKKRTVALLWCGQATSAIGDEIYRVALIWFAVGLIGADTGFLAATQSLAWLIFAAIGGSWADRWDHLRTMARVDFLRALIVVSPVLIFHFVRTSTLASLLVLGVVAFSVAGLGAFFDPALMATVPRFTDDTEGLKATTGLMSTTFRLARAIGPTIVALLAALIPMIQFFTLDGVTFVVSAVSIVLLGREPELRASTQKLSPAHGPAQVNEPSFRESLVSGFRAIESNPIMGRILLLKSMSGGLWYLAYGLGIALFVQRIAPGDTRGFGLVVGCYGIGNFLGAVILGNMKRSRPVSLVAWGYFFLGVGFVAMGVAPNLRILSLAAAFSGFMGPVNDLPVVDMIQTEFPVHDIQKIYRLRMAGEVAAGLVFMLISPALFRWFVPGEVIAAVGAVFVLFAGFCFFGLAPELAIESR